MIDSKDKALWELITPCCVQKTFGHKAQFFDFETQILLVTFASYHAAGVKTFNELNTSALNHAREMLVSLGGIDPHPVAVVEDAPKTRGVSPLTPK